MSLRPVVSVVIPLYNKGKDVERSLRSVLAQNVPEYEVVVVNDGSTDDGPDIVRGKGDSRIRIINQGNKGVSAARNRGLEEARSDLIAFLDADDEWEPDFLATILHLEKNFPECAVFATGYWYRTVNGIMRKPIFRGLPPGQWVGVLENYFEIAAISDPPLWTSAVAVRKEALLAVGGFPVGVTSGEDLLTWARLAVKYKIAYTSEEHAYFWEPGSVLFRPHRFIRGSEDIVGRELVQLFESVRGQTRNDLKNYLALWHTMRASIFVELGWNEEALHEVAKVRRLAGISWKTMYLFTLSILPSLLSKRLHYTAKRFKNKINSVS